jgi:hypothetical protein
VTRASFYDKHNYDELSSISSPDYGAKTIYEKSNECEMRKINSSVLFVIILGITTIILFCTLTNGHNWGDDFSAYIMQAKSITELNPRSFIEANRFTVENSSYPFGPIVPPWGFPIMLAPFYAVFGLNMIGLKILGVISFLIFLIILWVGFRKNHSPLWLLCLVCLFSLNPTMLSFSDQILTDLPFLALSTAIVLLMGRLIIEKRNLISQVYDYILLGIIIACAFIIRTNGLLLLITLAITQFITLAINLSKENYPKGQYLKYFRNFLSNKYFFLKSILINLLPYVSFFFFVMLVNTILPQGNALINSFSNVSIDVIKQYLGYYIYSPSNFFIGVPYYYLFYFISIPIAIIGIWKRYRSDYHAIVYIILTFVLYLIFPSTAGFRYLFPILPFYYSFVITGLEIFQGGKTNIEREFRKWVCLTPILIVLTYFGIYSAGNAYLNIINNRETFFGPYTKESQNMFSFIRSNTEKESTIVFFKPRLMRMMTNRKSLMLRTKQDITRGDYLCLHFISQKRDKVPLYEMEELLKLNFIIARSQVSPDVMAEILKQKSASLIYENSEFKVYKLIHSRIPFLNR